MAADQMPVVVAGDAEAELFIMPEFVLPRLPKNSWASQNSSSQTSSSEQNSSQSDSSKPRDRKRRRGRNEKRPPPMKIERHTRLCPDLVHANPEDDLENLCQYGEKCQFQHDLKSFLAESAKNDLGEDCPVLKSFKYCPRGNTCRFVLSHAKMEKALFRDEARSAFEACESNRLSKELQNRLRKKLVDFDNTDNLVEDEFKDRERRKAVKDEKINGSEEDKKNDINGSEEDKKNDIKGNEEDKKNGVKCDVSVEPTVKEDDKEPSPEHKDGLIYDSTQSNDKNEDNKEAFMKTPSKIDVDETNPIHYGNLRPRRKIKFEDQLYLAPLTTVGNLPYRRLCKSLGADITCGEMALALPLLKGHAPEWALLQRHRSEDVFGVQLAGNSPQQMARAAQLVRDEVDCDFVDINMGCPIDLIFQQGMGSGLMGRPKPLEIMIKTMTRVLNCRDDGPLLTVKVRTGVYGDKRFAHNLLPQLKSWGVAAATVHGRSREQRYTRLADWSYIDLCAEKCRPMPIFGNGDVCNFEDYEQMRAKAPNVAGVMLARGALVKPWLFTEIKERRHWDISAGERLELMRNFVHFGLEHWGSDTLGVERTRRFLLEWQSFLHRYVPHGILERPPQRLNQRPPNFRGRNDLETLLASTDCNDWVKISEMLLGKVPDNFCFQPKHKANSYK